MNVFICPEEIDGAVLSFCIKVAAGSTPAFVDVIPGPDCEKRECFQNVKQMVEQKGGKSVLGWQIFVWPRVLMEAEHHCIWGRADGQLVDITPRQDDGDCTLFLPDDTAVFDLSNHKRRDNIRKFLVKNANVREYIELCADKHKLIEMCTKGDRVSLGKEDGAKLASIDRRRFALVNELIRKYTWRNETCPCGSGMKYKHCHYKRQILPQKVKDSDARRL